MTRPLTGRIAADRIGARPSPPVSDAVLAGLRDLEDATGVLSDVLDGFGVAAAIPASVLAPLLPGVRLVGRALTVQNVAREVEPAATDVTQSRIVAGDVRLADIEAHNQAEPGDVLVVAGVAGISSMGRISATLGARQGELGAVVDGAVRDPAALRRLGYPVWARGASPITGKYRLETVAINRSVAVAGVTVHPGDVVVADEAGVVFIPRAIAESVLEAARAIGRNEASRLERIARGDPVPDLARQPRVP